MKFKVGDRVQHEAYGLGTVIYRDEYSVLVEFDRSYMSLHSGSGKGKECHCWWCYDEDLTPVFIHIKIGRETICTLPNGKTGTAVCAKADEYDEGIGVINAVARAYGYEIDDLALRSQKLEQGYDGIAYGLVSSRQITRGKKYVFVNGDVTLDDDDTIYYTVEDMKKSEYFLPIEE